MVKKNPNIVNLINTERWGKADSLYEIMAKMVFPEMRNMPINQLLFFSFLAGINVVIEAQERHANDK